MPAPAAPPPTSGSAGPAATTVAELTAVGVPSVLVPLPIAPHDHQAVNARQLEGAGAAVVLADADSTASAWPPSSSGLLADPGALDAMGDGRPVDGPARRRRRGGRPGRGPRRA